LLCPQPRQSVFELFRPKGPFSDWGYSTCTRRCHSREILSRYICPLEPSLISGIVRYSLELERRAILILKAGIVFLPISIVHRYTYDLNLQLGKFFARSVQACFEYRTQRTRLERKRLGSIELVGGRPIHAVFLPFDEIHSMVVAASKLVRPLGIAAGVRDALRTKWYTRPQVSGVPGVSPRTPSVFAGILTGTWWGRDQDATGRETEKRSHMPSLQYIEHSGRKLEDGLSNRHDGFKLSFVRNSHDIFKCNYH